jgi:hypothetical protein
MVSFFEFFSKGSSHSGLASPVVGSRESFCFGLPTGAPRFALRPEQVVQANLCRSSDVQVPKN